MDCGICYEKKESDDMKLLKCHHYLCHNCFDKLIQRKCPFCRQSFERICNSSIASVHDSFEQEFDDQYLNSVHITSYQDVDGIIITDYVYDFLPVELEIMYDEFEHSYRQNRYRRRMRQRAQRANRQERQTRSEIKKNKKRKRRERKRRRMFRKNMAREMTAILSRNNSGE